MEETELVAGWRYATVGQRHIDILPMLYNVRVVETPIGFEREPRRYWCYSDMDAATLALEVWDMAEDSEPVGWIRSWDDRHTTPGPGQRGVDGRLVWLPRWSHGSARW